MGEKIEPLLLDKQDNWEIQSQSPPQLLKSFTVDGIEISSLNLFKWFDFSLLQDISEMLSLRFSLLC